MHSNRLLHRSRIPAVKERKGEKKEMMEKERERVGEGGERWRWRKEKEE